ncbi:MAG: CoA activase [Desulfobacteraceae bacterium]|nr:MAG: CoA activase [Desulfobacteraceae bacterium]
MSEPNIKDTLFAGIDAGSVSLNGVVINQQKEIVYEAPYRRHLGNVEQTVLELIQNLNREFGHTPIQAFAFTGNHGQKISDSLGGFFEFETICQVRGCLQVRPDTRTIICMGGQDTALFQISHHPDQSGASPVSWELDYFNSNGPCASGTGSFIDQQAQRLATALYETQSHISQEQIDLILADFIRLGLRSRKPSNVACRCTVFTKSDMIHLQNKGEKLENIIYGLHIGNARNYISTIVSNRVLTEPIVFIGGLSLNELQVRAFKEYFPGLIVPPHCTSLGALGAAVQALEAGARTPLNLAQIHGPAGAIEYAKASKLELKQTDFPQDNRVHRPHAAGGGSYYLGIDIGSTETKYALIDKERQIVHKSYVPTQGKPIEVTQGLLKTLEEEMGRHMEINGVAVTGSGRNVVGDFLNADLIIDEITAHARGAVAIDPDIDTIFEIGGQDSKYISISHTFPLDFDMNKVCAAGTGSFLHELANKYGIQIVGEFEQIALAAETPVKLAERCTVFMESDLVSFHQKGLLRENLIAGLCYAIVHNYLNRVVGKRKIGRRIMFLGGPSLNQGVVAAFENVLGRGLIVPKHREVLGAFGAAISVLEQMTREKQSRTGFRGLQSAIHDHMQHEEKVCRADSQCHNQCKLKIYDFDGRRSVWGGECGRYEFARTRESKEENYFQLRDAVWKEHLAGLAVELKEKAGEEPVLEVDGRPTIGMQRSLYTLQTGVLWAHFFDQLGLRLVLTPPTNSRISDLGIEAMTAETCYPIKVSHGHVRELIGRTRFLFLPVVIDMPTVLQTEAGYYCPLVQSNPYMLRMALKLDEETTLKPIVHLKYDPKTLALSLAEQLAAPLNKKQSEIKAALIYALERQQAFLVEMVQKGQAILENHDPEKPLVIVSGRPYNLYDERLNLRLGRNLAKIGMRGLPMDFLDLNAVDLADFPNMYWGLGARILRTAKWIKAQPNTFGLHLTNFSCGADSFLEHFYRHIMEEKPYLILELDEHSAAAGVMTRLEAFHNVIENVMGKVNQTVYEKLRAAS